MRKKKNNKNGYTIIETMITISVFLVIITIGMGALLNANSLHQKSQNTRSIMDNLSFIMEDISRNLRTGYDYHCIDDDNINATNPHSCGSGEGISFKSAVDGSQWVYYIGDCNATNGICKSTDGANSFVQLVPSEVAIDFESSFSVLGAEPPPGDNQQPFVTIKLIGNINYKDTVTAFSLQTSVSQRLIDR